METTDPLDAQHFDELARQALGHELEADDIESTLVAFTLIRAANRLQQDLETSVHRPAGITWAAYRVMLAVHVAGPLRPAQLAFLSCVSAASISSVLNTLERNGFVQRRQSAEDRRSVVVTLTERGTEVVRELITVNNARESAWVEVLSEEERRTLGQLARKLLLHRPEPPAEPVKRVVPTRARARG